MSKLALISTWKDGAWKHRLILDCRVSGANSATSKYERIILPKVWDVVRDTLMMKARAEHGKDVSCLVCDYEDAFFKVPLSPAERKYFATALGDEIFIWERIGQGSLNGPTVFGRLSAMVGRLSQSMFSTSEARVQIYTDDPITTIYATPERTKRVVAIIIMAWMVLGFSMAFHKAQLAKTVDWVGYKVSSLYEAVKA